MAGRIAIVAGATGMVGKEILEGLLADQTVAAVHSLGRRAPAIRHPKLTAHVVDLAALPSLPPADEVYLAVGTTIRSPEARPPFVLSTTTPTLLWPRRRWPQASEKRAW
jgi:nucleoside-diphosphate-sugar epimerase